MCVPALPRRHHPLDCAPRPVLLFRFRESEQLASSDSAFVNSLLDEWWHVHDAAIGKRIQHLVAVLPGHFLPVVVFQCDLDRDVGLKLHLVAHFALFSLAATAAGGRSRRSTSSMG